jgi:hypothetical protein
MAVTLIGHQQSWDLHMIPQHQLLGVVMQIHLHQSKAAFSPTRQPWGSLKTLIRSTRDLLQGLPPILIATHRPGTILQESRLSSTEDKEPPNGENRE